jgi:hypothetical protein
MISSMWLKGVMLKILENINVSIIKDDFKQFQIFIEMNKIRLLVCYVQTTIKN